MTFFARGQVRRRSAAHTPAKKNNVTFLYSDDLSKIVIYSVSILFHLLFVRFTCFIQSVAGIFDSEYVHLHLSTEHVKEVEGEPNVFCISMEIDHYLIASVFTGQVQTRDVLLVFVVFLLRVLLLFYRCACLWSPHKIVASRVFFFSISFGFFSFHYVFWTAGSVSLWLETLRWK